MGDSAGSSQPHLRRSRSTANFTRSGPMPVGSSHTWASSCPGESTAPLCRSSTLSSRNSVGVSLSSRPSTVTSRFAGSTRTVPSSYTSSSQFALPARRSSASTLAISSWLANGLVRYSSAPARRPRTFSASWPCAVSISTGTSLMSRSRSSTCQPSMTGSPMSSTTSSGRPEWSNRRPVRPSRACSTSWPLRFNSSRSAVAMSWSSSTTSTRLMSSSLRCRGVDSRVGGQADRDGGAGTFRAGGADGAAVKLGDRTGDHQAEPGAGHASLDGVGRPGEGLEHPGQVGLGDPDSGVADLDPPAAGVGNSAYGYRPARVGELDGVADQVVHDLPQPYLVGGDLRAGRDVAVQPDAGPGRLLPPLARRGLQQVRQVDPVQLELVLPRLEPDQGQQVVDEPQQPVHVPLDHDQEVVLLGVQLAGLGQQPGEADHRGQRRTHLVRDRTHEFVLRLRDADQGLVVLLECPLRADPLCDVA